MRANESTRRHPLALLLFGIALLLFCGAAAWLESINPIELRSRVMFRSPDEARSVAIAKKRLLLFAFVAQRDLESAQLERELFANADVATKIDRDFVVVKLVDRTNSGEKNDAATSGLAAQFGVGKYPTLVIADPDGTNVIANGGYRGLRRAMTFLTMGAKAMRNRAPKRVDENAERTRATIEALSRIGGATSPSFAPDGKRIVFVSDLSGQQQLWTMDADGGFPEQLTSMPDGAVGAQWSPDGEWISFVSPPPGTRAPQVFVVRPDGTGMRRLTADAGERNICGFWTRDSKLSISTLRKTSTAMDAALFEPETGAVRVVATSPQFGLIVDVSCDNRRALILRRDGNARGLFVAGIDPPTPARAIFPPADEETIAGFDCDHNAAIGMSNHGRDRLAIVRISLASTSFGRTETVWSRDDAELQGSATSPDGTRTAAVWSRDGADELWVREASGESHIPLAADSIGSLRFSPDGSQLLLAASGAKSPSDLWVVNMLTKEVRRLTRSPHVGVDLASLAAPQLVRFRGANGLALSGWLYKAPNAHGAVISIHGGPMLQETPSMNARYQALIASGISVFAPNIRGSAGFGRRFLSLDDGARRFDAIADVKAAADYLVANRIAAPGHIGIMGESYGGWMTLAAISAYPSLFAAAVDEFGMSDLRDDGHETPDLAKMHAAEFGDDPKLLERLSPIENVAAIRTPTLVLHGAQDSQVAERQSSRLVERLRAQRTPVEYILFPDEGHIFRRHANRVRATMAIAEWFSKRLS